MNKSYSPITLLSDPLIDQIAAGEVIERPASLIKELVENSLDAGATRIDVILERGGIDLVQVIDDGRGMPKDDLPLSIVAHATSKISDQNDLQQVLTRGFRGEALASIGAVSELTVASRLHADQQGWCIQVVAGEVKEMQPKAMAPGTHVNVKHLFKRLPARRKFLKSARAEANRCYETLVKLALSTPHIHYQFTVDGRVRAHFSQAQSLVERMGQVLKINDLREATVEKESIKVTVCVAPPTQSKQTRVGQYYFVLGRPIKDRALSQVVWQATRDFIVDNRHAVLCAYIHLDPTRVDVNVHPTKEEVRFENPRLIASCLSDAIRRAVAQANYVGELYAPTKNNEVKETFNTSLNKTQIKNQINAGSSCQKPLARAKRPVEENWAQTGYLGQQTTASELPFRSYCQMHDAYIVAETDEGISILDQHALHERILLEKMKRDLLAGSVEKQSLLVPHVVDLLPTEASIILDLKEELHHIGFDLEDYGDGALAVSALPSTLSPEAVKGLLETIIEKSDGIAQKEQLRLLISRICACKSAVKAGDHLNSGEIESLLRDFCEEDYTFACEHGRPTHIRISMSDLAKGFYRH